MIVRETDISGCFEIIPPVFQDKRGSFVKTFHCGFSAEYGLVTSFAEEFYSWSRHGVLRGLHFQAPPSEQTKVVTCLSGEVLDVVLDLRIGSPTFGHHAMFTLQAAEPTLLYIPPGLAHGFLSISDETLMYYQVTSAYNPACDFGILWNSAGISWPTATPIISERDASFPTLENFSSPFIFTKVIQ